MINDWVSLISLLVGIVAILLSIFAMYLSHQSEKRQESVFNQINSLLHNIDKESALIKQSIKESNAGYLTIIDKLTDPQRTSLAEKFKQEINRSA